jgi:membrane peptidoglycan carboxypeptidase
MLDDFRSAYRNSYSVLGTRVLKASELFEDALGNLRGALRAFRSIAEAWTIRAVAQLADALEDLNDNYPSYRAVAEDWTRKGARALDAGRVRAQRHAIAALRVLLRNFVAFVRANWRGLSGLTALLVLAAAYEMQTSHFEARYFADLDRKMGGTTLKPGANASIVFPTGGPYDQRMGYAALPQFMSRLRANDYAIDTQARWSAGFTQFVKTGGYAVYREKDQGGLEIADRHGADVYDVRFPQETYRDYQSLPPLIVKSLLFTEDRYLLDPDEPERNAAIQWRRFGWAAFGRIARVFDPHFKVGGGSTLATQIEKFRHSPRGLTDSNSEKFHQMMTASARIYLDGPDTMARRQQVVTTYLNSTPLASMPGYGEIIGLPEALRVWFGISKDDATRILNGEPHDGAGWARKGEVYREALSMILSARRPDYYLSDHRDRLETLIDRYLRILAKAEVIEPRLRDAALSARLHFQTQPPPITVSSFVTQRAVNSVRNNLVSLLNLPNLYTLDRLDLKVQTTTDAETQASVSAFLGKLSDPDFLKAQGMIGKQLLGDGDPAKVTYSFVLYERNGNHNDLRVRAASLNQPFDINSGAMLQLGSTAKLRTLATYLDIIRNLHQELSPQSRRDLLLTADGAQDPLTFWAATYLSQTHDRELQPMLDAAMARHYSGAPGAFFTGSGRQGFGNFEKSENKSNPTLSLAFQHSINLSFVRLLRDIVLYYEVQDVPTRAQLLEDPHDPQRVAYLREFADDEGQSFLRHFYKQFQGQTPDAMMSIMVRQSRHLTGPLAALYLAVHPDASLDELHGFLASHLPAPRVTENEVLRVYETDSPARLTWQDLGYVSGVHPLELWLARYRIAHPSASWKEVAAASGDVRQEVYAWLFKGRMHRQDNRIRILLERAAFDRILVQWRSLGYPFEHLVPSLGTAVGASGDVPDALADLMGIILNDGVRLPTQSVTQLRFAANTPYETTFSRRATPSVRVMAPEIARTLRGVLTGVVADGTASRLVGAYMQTDGTPLPVGGKTGTGDNRSYRFTAGGGAIGSRTLDRTATFVFFLGNRFFGTVTAYVPSAAASHYHFSSALAVQLLKALQPQLQPLLGTAKTAAPAATATDATTAANNSPANSDGD